jgi:hypothetical protein
VTCLRSPKIDEDLARAVLKCGGLVFVSCVDTRIALQTGRSISDTGGNWLTEESSQRISIYEISDQLSLLKKLEISEISIVGLASLLLRTDRIKPQREKCEMFDDLYRAQKNATCDAKCNELSNIENHNMLKQSKTCFSENVCSLTTPKMEIEIPPLPESDLDSDALAILGDPIRRAFLGPQLFEAVASPISDLPMSMRRLHQIFDKADAPIKLEPIRFHTPNTPEIRARARECKITEKWDCRYKRIATSIADDPVSPLQRGLPCSLIQCMWNLIKFSPYFPLVKRPLISARLHSPDAPSRSACFRHSTRYHQKRWISGARDQGGKRRATDHGGNTEAVNQGGNRASVESEWRKVMRINEAERRAKVDTGGDIRSVETEWRREMRIDEAERGEKMDASWKHAIVEESGQAQAWLSLGKWFRD